ncbi:MAG: Lrp/AsnC family transcriptional regulator [Methanospirillaceae archaeon]|nr:Lrp/AsnC family transcriptional regulator [Methanospirillaceae archaeon]
MDKTDSLLLGLLEKDCTTPVHELAVMLEVPETEIVNRKRILEEKGIINRYSAVINWEETDRDMVYAIIDLKVTPEHEHGYDRIAEKISWFSQVQSLFLKTGTHDLQLVVKGESMHEIAAFVAEHIAPMDQVHETVTHIIMKTYKQNGIVYHEREKGKRLPFSF